MKNDYVKLEPRPKETFECADALTIDSSVQVIVNKKLFYYEHTEVLYSLNVLLVL